MATVQTRVGPVSYSDDGVGRYSSPCTRRCTTAMTSTRSCPRWPAATGSSLSTGPDTANHPLPEHLFTSAAALYADVLEDVV